MNDVIDFSKMPCIYWSESTKISYLQRRVIVYSIMYYQLNESCISDHEYDAIVKQLVRFQNKASEKELKKSKYYYVMYDFEGSTGFHLFNRLNSKDKSYLLLLAQNILNQWRMEN